MISQIKRLKEVSFHGNGTIRLRTNDGQVFQGARFDTLFLGDRSQEDWLSILRPGLRMRFWTDQLGAGPQVYEVEVFVDGEFKRLWSLGAEYRGLLYQMERLAALIDEMKELLKG